MALHAAVHNALCRAGRYNYTVLVNHLAPGVIASGEEEAGTKMFRGKDEGLGHAVSDINL